MSSKVFLDCTLRDGGYYNSWDFDYELINDYLVAVNASGVDVVELGFRITDQQGFKGACAYTTDSFIRTLEFPEGITFCVMINASDIIANRPDIKASYNKLKSAKYNLDYANKSLLPIIMAHINWR